LRLILPRLSGTLLAASFGLTLAMAFASAQTPPKPATPATPPAAKPSPAPTPAPAPAATSAPAPTPGQLATARELVVACGISRSFDVLVPQFMDRIGTSLTQTRPELIRDLNTVMEQLQPEFASQSSEMIDSAALVYTQLMTEDELKSAVAFFKSDAGRKYVDSQPAFMSDVVATMQTWQNKIAAHMIERVRQEMRKKGHEL
jgi:hypothetical protein